MKKFFARCWRWMKKNLVFGAAGFTVTEGLIHGGILISTSAVAFSQGLIPLGIGLFALAMVEMLAPLYLSYKVTTQIQPVLISIS